MAKQKSITCSMYRSGTSRGLYFLAGDLPNNPVERDSILSAAMGSGNSLQINGMGGGSTLTSKVAIVSHSTHPDAEIDYLFAQVSIDDDKVDTNPTCGNMLSAVGAFAIERGLIQAQSPETKVRVQNVNTRSIVELIVPTPEGVVEYEGDTSIDGVPGSSASIVLNFLDVAGSKTSGLLPTGRVRDVFDGIEVTCMDAAVPMVLIPAEALGKKGTESKSELDEDTDLLKKIESIRQQASLEMGLGDATGKVIPKVALLSKPANGGTITSRYFVPQNCHAAHAVTGAICVASSVLVPGSIASELADYEASDAGRICIEHPSGKIDLVLSTEPSDAHPIIRRAGLIRTARKLFEGDIFVPSWVKV